MKSTFPTMHVTLNDSHHGRQVVRILSAFSYCLEGTLLPAHISHFTCGHWDRVFSEYSPSL